MPSSTNPSDSRSGVAWLLLVHQLPAEPSRTRVKFWRRLQGVGAVAIKNSVYVLPDTRETREDFEWIRGEIIAEGGEAIVFSGIASDGIGTDEIRNAFMAARQQDWQELRNQCEAKLTALETMGAIGGEVSAEVRRLLKGWRSRVAQIDRIDHLKAPGRREALLALARFEEAVGGRGQAPGKSPSREIQQYQKRIWITRPRPGVDRMASAWLIRRFIDPEAQFSFADRIPPDERIIPFDMFGVELGHQGERVTFETLLHEFGLSDPALQRIARLVHVLDLRLEPADDAEAATVQRIIAGLRASLADDHELLAHGMALFEALCVAEL